MTRDASEPSFHTFYYIAPASEAAGRTRNIRDYYYMLGVRANVVERALDNDEDHVLLITSLFNVNVDDELLHVMFHER